MKIDSISLRIYFFVHIKHKLCKTQHASSVSPPFPPLPSTSPPLSCSLYSSSTPNKAYSSSPTSPILSPTSEQIPIQPLIGFCHLSFKHECHRIPAPTCTDSATNLPARMDSIRELLRADSSTNLLAQMWSDSSTNSSRFKHKSRARMTNLPALLWPDSSTNLPARMCADWSTNGFGFRHWLTSHDPKSFFKFTPPSS